MASKISLVVAILFIFVLVVVHANSNESTTGFTIQLIPPISPDSPFYQSIHNNLTITDHGRSTSTAWMNHSYPSNNVRIPMRSRVVYYVTRLMLGVPSQPYTLVVDTASELTWTQCQPCRLCYPQTEPIFNPTHSRTYRSLPCSHPVCRPRNPRGPFRCVNNRCTYDIAYISGSRTQGFASQESFWLLNSHMSVQALDNVVFGCSNYNYRFAHASLGLAGILGMNNGPTSLTTQLSSITNGRFSYCLRTFSDPQNSLIKFGDDIVIPEGRPLQTPLNLASPSPQYQLKLLDIGFDSRRLGIPSSTFALGQGGSGGCWLDTGSMATHLPRSAYDRVKQVVKGYFDSKGLQRVDSTPEGLEVCYRYRYGFRDYPKMTYYFEGAAMSLTVESSYYFKQQEGYFCWPALPSSGQTIIGVVNQQNMRFVFDRRRRVLQFIHANCAADRIGVST